MTHLEYIQAVRDIAAARLNEEERAKVMRVQMVYGSGSGSHARGLTFYGRWDTCKHGECKKPDSVIDLVEVCAFGEENPVQLAGTTLHELGHVLAHGPGDGHGKAWKEACGRLGLRRVKAAGTFYVRAMFAPDIRGAIAQLPLPHDGTPAGSGLASLLGILPVGGPGCSHGRGSRGGTSTGKGSGRMRKFVCQCEPPVIVRAARDKLEAHCDLCGAQFHQSGGEQ